MCLPAIARQSAKEPALQFAIGESHCWKYPRGREWISPVLSSLDRQESLRFSFVGNRRSLWYPGPCELCRQWFRFLGAEWHLEANECSRMDRGREPPRIGM